MMVTTSHILVASFLFICTVRGDNPVKLCEDLPSTKRTVNLFLRSKKGDNGEWKDTFSAWTDASNSTNSVNLDVTHTVIECEEGRVLFVQVVTNDDLSKPERLTFHPKSGTNVAILNKGRTAQKINLDVSINCMAFTSRPLKNNEIFEVRLEKKITKFSNSLGFGVSTKSPTDIEIVPEMWTSPFAWMMHHSNIYHNSKDILGGYGRNLNGLQVGDRVGVMRNEYGTVHFFINGVDQGPAVYNVTYPVYGLLDLYYNAAKATIVDAANPISPET